MRGEEGIERGKREEFQGDTLWISLTLPPPLWPAHSEHSYQTLTSKEFMKSQRWLIQQIFYRSSKACSLWKLQILHQNSLSSIITYNYNNYLNLRVPLIFRLSICLWNRPGTAFWGDKLSFKYFYPQLKSVHNIWLFSEHHAGI